MGGIWLLAAASPFEASLEPSEATKARSGPVTAGTSAMRAGSAHTVSWRGKPVWLMRRGDAMVRAAARRPGASRPVVEALRSAARLSQPDAIHAPRLCHGRHVHPPWLLHIGPRAWTTPR